MYINYLVVIVHCSLRQRAPSMYTIRRLWLAYPFRMPCSQIVAVCNIQKQGKHSILCHLAIPLPEPPTGRVVSFWLMYVSRYNTVRIPCVQRVVAFAFLHPQLQNLISGKCSISYCNGNNNLHLAICRFINFGNVQSKPVFKDGQLLLRHETSRPCDKNSSMNYASVINFYCDRKAFVCIQ